MRWWYKKKFFEGYALLADKQISFNFEFFQFRAGADARGLFYLFAAVPRKPE